MARGIRSLTLISLILFIWSYPGCARIKYAKTTNIQTGQASWYGPGFHGQKTSNKEIYNMYDMTAAHKTLPFGTYVMVTNLNNDMSITVRINDRGPFVKGRIIDLSYAAAKMLNMIDSGTAPVRIEILEDLSPNLYDRKFSIQAGAFSIKSNAESLKKKLDHKYSGVYIASIKTGHQIYYRVRIKATSKEEATKIARRLKKDGYSVIILEQ